MLSLCNLRFDNFSFFGEKSPTGKFKIQKLIFSSSHDQMPKLHDKEREKKQTIKRKN